MNWIRLSLLLVIMQGVVPAIAQRTWTGNTSAAWNVAGNWSGSVLPGVGETVIFTGTPANDCQLAADVTVGAIQVNASFTRSIDLNSKKITVSGLAASFFYGGTVNNSGTASEINFSGS